VEEFIAGGTAPAEQQIRNVVACELAYINTSHPQFIGGNRAIAQVRACECVIESLPLRECVRHLLFHLTLCGLCGL
jgi:hypothetical protein